MPYGKKSEDVGTSWELYTVILLHDLYIASSSFLYERSSNFPISHLRHRQKYQFPRLPRRNGLEG